MRKRNWIVAAALGGVAAVLYFVSMANYAFPGEGARLMACWQGLLSDPSVRFPLLSLFARALGGGNLIAPVCGVVSVMTLYHLTAAFFAWRMSNDRLARHRTGVAQVAAVSAAAVFMLTPAVRQAATHLEPRLFEFAWALLAFALVLPSLRWATGASWVFPVAMGVMAGLGMCDTALFIVYAPLYVTAIVLVHLRLRRAPYMPVFLFVASAIVALLAGIFLFKIGMKDWLRASSAELNGYRTVPGWIFVAAFATLPFVTSLFASGKSYVERPELVQWLFHVAMSFVAVLAVATQLSPSLILEPYGILPVVTSAYAAFAAGYLLSFWWLNRRRAVAMVTGGALAFVLAVNAAWNLVSFDGDRGAFADRVARRIVEDLGDRRWLVTDGSIDNHLRLVASQMGRDIHFVSLARDNDSAYIDELKEVVRRENLGGSKNSQLLLSLNLGVVAFVQDWFAADPTVPREVAIFGAPDLWYATGFTPVPEFLFFGADPARVPDWPRSWAEFKEILPVPEEWGSYRNRVASDPTDRLRYSLRRHLGFVANNRGVWLQDQNRDDEAFAMYELVLKEIDRDNICALFNELEMANRRYPGALAKRRELERLLKTVVDDTRRRYLLWRLGTYYGYIRNPDAFVRLGHVWARTGRAGEAMSQVRRAADLVPEGGSSVLLNLMASLYANENAQDKSRELYERVLTQDERDHDALIGLMRLEMRAGSQERAMMFLERAADVSGDTHRGRVERAMLALMKSDLPAAKSLLKKATDEDPNDMQAWSLLSTVIMQQIDAAKDEAEKLALTKELNNDVFSSMEVRSEYQTDYHLMTTKGFMLLREGPDKRAEARDAFLAASKTRPDVVSAQDMVLGLDISLADTGNAEKHAKDVLRRNRNAPLADYVLGSIALGSGKYDEAEAYLRKAADAPQPVALALNDLAEVLRRLRRFDEAESYARRATADAASLYVAWDTLGAVLIDSGKSLDEAEACIRRACELSKDGKGNDADVRMLVSLARVQLLRGDQQHAKVTIRKVRARIDELSEFERVEFEEICKGAR